MDVDQKTTVVNENIKIRQAVEEKTKLPDLSKWTGNEYNSKTEESQTAPNPDCKEMVCMPSFWVQERNLCLYCGYRG